MQEAHFCTKTLVLLLSLQGDRSAGCSWWGTQPSTLLLLPVCSSTGAPSATCWASLGNFGKTAFQATSFQLAEVPRQLATGLGARLLRQRCWHKAGQRDAEAEEGPALSKPAPTETCLKQLRNCSPGASISSRKAKSCSLTDARLHQALEKPQLFSTKLPRKKMLHISAVSLVLSTIYLGCEAFSVCDTPHSHVCNLMQHRIKLPESSILK